MNDIRVLPSTAANSHVVHFFLPRGLALWVKKYRSEVRKGLLYKGEFKNCCWTPVGGSLVMPVPVRTWEIVPSLPEQCQALSSFAPFPQTWNIWTEARERGCFLQNLCRFFQLALSLQNPEWSGVQGVGEIVGCLSCVMWCTNVLKSLTSCCKLLSAHPCLTCEHKNSHVPGILNVFFSYLYAWA